MRVLLGLALTMGAMMARPAAAGPGFGPPLALNGNAAGDTGDDTRPQLATDGAGTWVAVWVSTDDLGGTLGGDNDILVARSQNGGTTWSAPAALDPGAAGDGNAFDFAPHLATDGAGTWIAVWASTNDLGGTIGSDPDILLARSTDGGATWTAPVAVAGNAGADGGADDRPWVASDGGAAWLVAWDAPGAFGSDRDLLYARSLDGGVTWTPVTALNGNAAGDAGSDQRVQVAAGAAGEWLAVWASTNALGAGVGEDLDVHVARSSDGGASWSAPAALNGDAASDAVLDDRPQLAVAPGGIRVAVWVSAGTPTADLDLFSARSLDGGLTWSPPAAFPTAAEDDGNDASPHLATDGHGDWVVVWESTATLQGTIGAEGDVLMARSADDGTTWTAPLPLNATAATDAGADRSPRIVSDGAGRWIAVWISDEPDDAGLGGDDDVLYAVGLPRCGNGSLDAGEFCDDGNEEDGDGCSSTCELPATPTPTPTATLTPTPTPAATGTVTAPPPPSATALATVTAPASATATPTALATGTATLGATPTPGATATVTPSAPATPAIGLADRAAAKAALACQGAVQKAMEGIARARFRALAACEKRLQKCVQLRPGDAACLDGAAERCARALAKTGGEEARRSSAAVKRCAPGALAAVDLLSASGLGYGAIAPDCEARFGIVAEDAASVVACVVRQHACHVERMVEVLAPRTKELMRLAPSGGVVVDPLACLPDHGGAGEALADPTGAGAALARCSTAIASAGASFVRRGQRRHAKCGAAVLRCLQTEPGSAACVAKAAGLCDKRFAEAARDERRLTSAVDRRCAEARIAWSLLRAQAGAALDGVAAQCDALGIPVLDGLGAYQQCVVRHQTCRLAELTRFALPRAPELLARVGHELEAAYCPPFLPLGLP